MTLEAVYYVSQIVSTLALVVSVVYLGRQTHLAARSQIAQMHQARIEQFHDMILHMTDPEFAPIATAAMHGDLTLGEEQVRRFYFYGVSQLRAFEEMFRQWQDGMLATDRWETSQRTLAGMIRAPGYRGCFNALRSALDPRFVALVDRIIASNAATPGFDPMEDWRSGVNSAIRLCNARWTSIFRRQPRASPEQI